MALQLLQSALPDFFTSSGFCLSLQLNESLFMNTFFFLIEDELDIRSITSHSGQAQYSWMPVTGKGY